MLYHIVELNVKASNRHNNKFVPYWYVRSMEIGVLQLRNLALSRIAVLNIKALNRHKNGKYRIYVRII